MATYYFYWYNGYDYAYGYTHDTDGSQGLYTGFTYNSTDENGFQLTYYVYDVADGDVEGLGGEDYTAYYSYYDFETGQTDTPYYFENYGYSTTSAMLGSYEYVDFGDGDYSEGFFGYFGYYEADDETFSVFDISGTMYTDVNGDGQGADDQAGTPGQTFTIGLYNWIDTGDGTVQEGELTWLDETETDEATGVWSFNGLGALAAGHVLRARGGRGWLDPDLRQ
ncbi:hypothetical protein [Marimonas lutisalis]|uniref:hypothetical protein n=1 Tax=Marimonas lutisalis TaxID=2545756 RepID=UPI00195F7277|nr:hypothetical protein [Marimonas lutisalis]